jgi:hypothetical protein
MKQSVRLAQIFRKDIQEVLERIAPVFMNMPLVLPVRAAAGITMEEVATHRMQFLTQIIRLLLTITPEERTRTIRDEKAEYKVDTQPSLEIILEQAPLP